MTEVNLTFARTKIQAPRQRADLIDRTALQAQMSQALQRQKLVLLLAPAGWGKTSALAGQLALLPSDTGVAWVSADEEDVDAVHSVAAPSATPTTLHVASVGNAARGSRVS